MDSWKNQMIAQTGTFARVFATVLLLPLSLIDKQSLFGRADHAVVKTVLEHSCDAQVDAGIVLGSQDRGWSALFEAPMQVSGRARPGFAV